MMITNNIRKMLHSSIEVPAAIINSEAYKQRNKNIKPKETKVESANELSCNEIKSKPIESCRQNTIFDHSSSIKCDLSIKVKNKQAYLVKLQAPEEIKMNQINAKSSKVCEVKDFSRKVIENKVSKFDLALKPIKSQSEILEEKSNKAEDYLRKLGNELFQLRSTKSDLSNKNNSITPSVSEFSQKQKKQ